MKQSLYSRPHQRICIAYAISGFVALGYQVFWFRYFVERFGANNLTFTLVVMSFIGGLGIGAWFSPQVFAVASKILKTDNALRLYGTIEIILASLVLLTPLLSLVPSTLFGVFPYQIHSGIYYPSLELRVFQSWASVCIVMLPCFIMGTTFPFLCQAFRHIDRFPSSLYAWNSLGACSAVLICEFIFIPGLGDYGTFAIVWVLNIMLGWYFVQMPAMDSETEAKPEIKAPPSRKDRQKRKSNRHRQESASHTEESGQRWRMSNGTLYLGAAMSGMAAGILEAGMHQIVSFAGYPYANAMSFLTFWAILAISLGSWTVNTFRGINLFWIKWAYGVAAVFYTIIRFRFSQLAEWFKLVRDQNLAANASDGIAAGVSSFLAIGSTWVFVGVIVFPVFYLVSLFLPYVCNTVQSRGRGLERYYALNTVAFCFGILFFSRFAPRVSIFYSIKLHAWFFLLLAILLFLIRRNGSMERWKYVSFGLAAVALAFMTKKDFDPGFFPKDAWIQKANISSLTSDGVHTTYVAERDGFKKLYFDGHTMSSNRNSDQVYMRLMAHFPLLAHSDPKSALLICFGVGNTASAIAAHSSIKRIDIVDLNDKVIQTAPEFSETNFEVYKDPRVTFFADDGRHFLDVSDRLYDFITSEPPPPMKEGIYRLYSIEYYKSVARHLSPNGIMTQWLPLRQLTGPANDLMVSAFNQAFNYSLIFVGFNDHLILLGSNSPVDLSNVWHRFYTDPKVVEDMTKRGMVGAPEWLLPRIVQSDSMLDARFGSNPVLSDRKAELSHYQYSLARPLFEYDAVQLANDLFSSESQAKKVFVLRTSNYAALKDNVPDFPDQFIKFSKPDPSSSRKGLP